MPAYPPPPYVAYLVDRAAPGFWSEFRTRATRALSGLDVVVTSWWRGQRHNVRVGGSVDSQHLLGTAFDVSGRQWRLAAARLREQGFIVIEYAGHAHAQAWPAGTARRAGLLAPLGV